MLGLNQMKKVIYLAVFLVGLSFSSSAWGSAEVSAHFGVKFGSKLNLNEIGTNWIDQKHQSFHFGADTLYRLMVGDTGSFGVGLRYRFAFTGEKNYEGTTTASNDDKYKFTHHRIALLANYRFHIDHFFVGPVLGIDIWKSLMFSHRDGDGAAATNTEMKSNQFLWNNITGQIGLEFGYQVTDNLLIKLEGGYDLSSFGFSGEDRCKVGTSDTEMATCSNNLLNMESNDENAKSVNKLRLNAFYATLGIGWFFG